MQRVFKAFSIAPLPSSFMFMSIIGVLITLYYFNRFPDKSFAVSFLLIFILMLIASIISFEKAPPDVTLAMDHYTQRKR